MYIYAKIVSENDFSFFCFFWITHKNQKCPDGQKKPTSNNLLFKKNIEKICTSKHKFIFKWHFCETMYCTQIKLSGEMHQHGKKRAANDPEAKYALTINFLLSSFPFAQTLSL